MNGRSRYAAALPVAALLALTLVTVPARAMAADPPTLTIADATAAPDTTEGNAGDKPFTFDVTLTGSVTEPVSVTARTFAGSAVVVSDFTDTLAQLTFTEAGTQQVTVPVKGDHTQEGDEDFIVRITTTTPAVTIADATGVADIINDDGPMVRVTPPASAVTEPAAGATPKLARFTVTATSRAAPAQYSQDVVVGYRTIAGTAVPGEDYQHVEGTVTLAAPAGSGPVTATIDVPILGDDLYEGAASESFTLELVDLRNAVWELDGTSQPLKAAVGLVKERDAPPLISIADAEMIEGADGDEPTAVVTVSLSQRSAQPVAFTYETKDGTGASPARVSTDDYSPVAPGTPGIVPALARSTTLVIAAVGDDVAEDNEIFHVDLALPAAENGAVLDPDNNSADVTIRNDDGVVITIDDVAQLEGAAGTTTPFVFTVTLSEAVGTPVEVTYATSDGNTTADGDYQSTNGDLTIPAGETTGSVTVTVIGDGYPGPDEDFYLDLLATSPGFPGPTIMRARGVGTIRNDDGPAITIVDVAALEGDPDEGAVSPASVTDFEFTVTLSEPLTDPDLVTDVSVDYRTRHVSTTDEDYDPVVGTLVIPEGETVGTVTVPVKRDSDAEPTEDFELVFSGAVNGYLVDGADVATGTIINDDGPTISIADIAIAEGDSGPTDASFDVTLSEASADTVTVDFATVDGTATVGDDDYTPTSGTVKFTPGTTERTVMVAVRGDERFEAAESFTVELSRPAFGALGGAVATGMIGNDDENRPPVVEITAPPTVESWVPVELTSTSTDPDGHATVGHAWRLGDGRTADGDAVTHVFTRSGVFAIELAVTDELGATGTASVDVIVTDAGEVTRSAGQDRIDTAVEVSRRYWDAAEHAVLATAWNYPDALAGGSLAVSLDAPLLLADGDALPASVGTELDRLGVSTVWVLGGVSAVSPTVEDTLLEAGYTVRRLAGEDRFETAALVAGEVGAPAGIGVLALGIHDVPDRSWPDALAAGALAATPDHLPTLLTRGDSLPAATLDAFTTLGIETVFVVGGPAAISEAVEARLVELGYEVGRLAGATRYGTSVAVAREALKRQPDGPVPLVVATGQNFPDGLAAAALGGRLGGLVVLVPRDPSDAAIAEFLRDNAERIDVAVVVGGVAAISEAVQDWIATLISAT